METIWKWHVIWSVSKVYVSQADMYKQFVSAEDVLLLSNFPWNLPKLRLKHIILCRYHRVSFLPNHFGVFTLRECGKNWIFFVFEEEGVCENAVAVKRSLEQWGDAYAKRLYFSLYQRLLFTWSYQIQAWLKFKMQNLYWRLRILPVNKRLCNRLSSFMLKMLALWKYEIVIFCPIRFKCKSAQKLHLTQFHFNVTLLSLTLPKTNSSPNKSSRATNYDGKNYSLTSWRAINKNYANQIDLNAFDIA